MYEECIASIMRAAIDYYSRPQAFNGRELGDWTQRYYFGRW